MIDNLYHRTIRRRLFLSVIALCLLFVASCEQQGQQRPFGVRRLRKVEELARAPESFFEEDGFIVRYDEGGFSVMSTMSTDDLTLLKMRKTDNNTILVSSDPLNTSTYDMQGNVLTGPAKKPLPYYELELSYPSYCEPGKDCRRDTLFAKVGNEVSRDWRFKVPKELLIKPSAAPEN